MQQSIAAERTNNRNGECLLARSDGILKMNLFEPSGIATLSPSSCYGKTIRYFRD